MSSKEGLVKSLLSPSGSSGVSSGPLIFEVGAPAVSPVEPPAPAADGPTMLEMMMAAQAEAKKEKEVEVEVQKKKTTKSFGDGFKKGFFGSEPKPKSKTTSTATSATTPTTAAANGVTKTATTSSPSPASSSSSSIPTISKPKAHVSSASSSSTSAATLVLDEVQEAMREDENPMVKQLKQGGSVAACCIFHI